MSEFKLLPVSEETSNAIRDEGEMREYKSYRVSEFNDPGCTLPKSIAEGEREIVRCFEAYLDATTEMSNTQPYFGPWEELQRKVWRCWENLITAGYRLRCVKAEAKLSKGAK